MSFSMTFERSRFGPPMSPPRRSAPWQARHEMLVDAVSRARRPAGRPAAAAARETWGPAALGRRRPDCAHAEVARQTTRHGDHVHGTRAGPATDGCACVPELEYAPLRRGRRVIIPHRARSTPCTVPAPTRRTIRDASSAGWHSVVCQPPPWRIAALSERPRGRGDQFTDPRRPDRRHHLQLSRA